jgi:plasmid maintenance system antidote protein VapI
MTDQELPGVVALRQWLEDEGLSAYKFARKNDLDPNDLRRLLQKGNARVSVEVAFKIERGTGGAVKAEMFVPVETDRAAAPKDDP